MRILFKKGRDKITLSCIRADGSRTWSDLQEGTVFHDLAHYIVEKKFEFTQAFYGLIKQGFNIGDFELPAQQRPQKLMPKNLPEEALVTEHLVNLLQVLINHPDRTQNLLEQLNIICSTRGFAFKPTPENINTLFYKLEILLQEWENIPVGEVLELNF